MTRTLIRTLAVATFLMSAPAYAQEADHSVHHPGGEAPAAESAAATPAPPAATPLDAAAPAVTAAAPTGMPGTASGGMDCMKMMQGMMGGGMPMMNGRSPAGMPMAGGAMPMGGGMPMMGGQSSGGMPMMGSMAAPAPQAAAGAAKAFRIATERMHAGMAIDYSGDADADFVRGMIAHHRGAIEMAEAVLEHGDDPEIRKLAEGVIAAQEAEVDLMRKWLLARKGATR